MVYTVEIHISLSGGDLAFLYMQVTQENVGSQCPAVYMPRFNKHVRTVYWKQ